MACTKDTVKENGLNIWSLPEAGCSSEVEYANTKISKEMTLISHSIIAVQGLGSHPFYTWVRKVPRSGSSTSQARQRRGLFSQKNKDRGDEGSSEVMWLRDLLPSELKNTRIATYSYQSDWRDREVKTTLRQCSEQFLNILLQNRDCDEERHRPIVLIGHSLGGLVIQQALNIAVHGDDYADIRHSVIGVIFLGAPFRGSELAVYGKWYAKAAGFDHTLLGLLEKDNSYLHGLSRDFWASYGKRDIVCFYENRDAEYGPWKPRVVDAQSASIQGKRMIYMDTDHSGLNKFNGADDENYMLLLPEIRRMVKGASSAMADRQQNTTVPTELAIRHDQVNQKRHWIVPFGRNEYFIGRESILERLLARIPPSVQENNCQRTAIEGLGGIGKTQIALEAAFRVRDKHPDCAIFWVPAVDVTSFENAYRKIGQVLKVNGIDEDKTDVKLPVREALDCESAGKWLLIIDNADDTEIFFGNAGLSNYLPYSHKGSILFTTRDHKATVDLSSTSIPITKLERGESHKLLETSLDKHQLQNTEDTTRLLDFLEDLPLAIKQASAFMVKEAVSTTDYLEFCQSSEEEVITLLSENFRDLHRYEEIPNPVVKAFRISFERISKCDPLAADYLRFISFLAEKAIPRVFKHLANVIPWAEHTNKSIWMGYLPHVQNLAKFSEDANDITAKENLLHKLGRCLLFLGRYEEAEDMLRKALELGGDVQGELVPNRLEVMGDLGYALNTLHRYEEAEKILWEVVELKKAAGEIDYHTRTSMKLLADTLANQKNFEESENMCWQVLELIRETLGTRQRVNSHPDTSRTSVDNNAALLFYEQAEDLHQQAQQRQDELGEEIVSLLNGFARTMLRQGRCEEAEQVLRRSLPLAHTSLGAEHPVTCRLMGRLGISLYQQGKSKSKEAVEVLHQTLELFKKVGGKLHPQTLEIMHYLGVVLSGHGDSEEAVKILRQTLEMRERVLGKEDPDTLATIHSLGVAVKILRQTLEIRERVLGKEDPDTLNTKTSDTES
ncbi:hypothetical protein F4801DRAFT_594485 [Xylaria longipes]|nr:hypothetical protein F4801DRAFT_594485 [Xylaria longipes]